MRVVPPSASAAQSSSTSSIVVHLSKNDTDGLNRNRGPALIARKGWPHSSNDTASVSPEGVSWIVVTLVILESGRVEQ